MTAVGLEEDGVDLAEGDGFGLFADGFEEKEVFPTLHALVSRHKKSRTLRISFGNFWCPEEDLFYRL